ncbi:hypothetical protein CEXT_556591 [Caerostris extrusa]|uniref:Uncharacterized protein n=1 Tax=Caerostris extrusa TaxID=172846 RepID=A0AAV4MJP4_CAEEX|nr:hypothetical protein CEXT_556591 [Caerostris extrusa]
MTHISEDTHVYVSYDTHLSDYSVSKEAQKILWSGKCGGILTNLACPILTKFEAWKTEVGGGGSQRDRVNSPVKQSESDNRKDTQPLAETGSLTMRRMSLALLRRGRNTEYLILTECVFRIPYTGLV